MTFRDTIAAIATPPGVGGVGLIRISGPAAKTIGDRLFRPTRSLSVLDSHRLYHGTIVQPETGQVLDEVLVALFKAPHSYTGEDILEINCHGGPLLLRAVLDEVLHAGARPAGRGEFTKRAFLNDRLDLSQAEAVFDLITAQTQAGLNAATDALQGRFSERIEVLRSRSLDCLASIEATIDFDIEDGVVETGRPESAACLRLAEEMTALAATYRKGRIVREGLSLVIVGRPNVGKSSLLNRLLGEQRAIVTDQPGTTRDFIEEAVDIGGIAVRFTDTAGVHPTTDRVEKAGIDLVWERLGRADAVLVLIDGSRPLTAADRDLLGKILDKPLLPVLNKADLLQQIDREALRGVLPATAWPPISISAKYGNGIEELKQAILGLLPEAPVAHNEEGILVTHLRHRQALEQAASAMSRAGKGLEINLSPELVAIEVREAVEALGGITGYTTPEEVLDRIFSRFCIGK